MSEDFSVMPVDTGDFEGISALLRKCAMMPGRTLWSQFCANISGRRSIRRSAAGCDGERAFIVVDRNGAIRGFCTVWQREHPIHHRMLDVPIMIADDSPSRNAICRTLFDHLCDMARRACCDALRFGNVSPAAWKERLAPDRSDWINTGLVMPLGVPTAIDEHESAGRSLRVCNRI